MQKPVSNGNSFQCKSPRANKGDSFKTDTQKARNIKVERFALAHARAFAPTSNAFEW